MPKVKCDPWSPSRSFATTVTANWFPSLTEREGGFTLTIVGGVLGAVMVVAMMGETPVLESSD